MYEKTIITLYGTRGQLWLEALPNLIKNLSDTWGLSSLVPASNLSYNYVLFGIRHTPDTLPVVLKLSPDTAALHQEAIALRAFWDVSHTSVIRVLEEQEGALLLERALPGITLASYFPERDQEALVIAAKLMNQLHEDPMGTKVFKKQHPYSFPPIADWLAALDKQWPIPHDYLTKARMLRDHLLATSNHKVLLHGDLHHDNILLHENNWVIIDPKGVIGEPAYDAATFIRNPMLTLLEQHDASAIITTRIACFAQHLFAHNLDEGYERITQWCFVQAVLAWVWNLEDRLDCDQYEQLTKIFYAKIKD